MKNYLFLIKALASRLPKEHANKFQDNVQAATVEFTFDALLKVITRTITLLEGGLLRSRFASRISATKGGGTTSRTNKSVTRIVTLKYLSAELPS